MTSALEKAGTCGGVLAPLPSASAADPPAPSKTRRDGAPPAFPSPVGRALGQAGALPLHSADPQGLLCWGQDTEVGDTI